MKHKYPLKRGKANRTASPSEAKHMKKVAALGCICCRLDGNLGSVAQIHHLRVNPDTGTHLGLGQRSQHLHTIGLCPQHHLAQYPTGIHAWRPEFFENYGSEIELWNMTQELLAEEGNG